MACIFNLQKMRRLLLQAKENWEEFFNTINDAICIYDDPCNIIRTHKAAEQTFGPPLLEFLMKPLSLNRFAKTLRVLIDSRNQKTALDHKGG
jgi:hypothetical protein